VTYPDITQWVSTTRANCGRDSKLGQWLVQLRECFTYCNISNTGILITNFTSLFS